MATAFLPPIVPSPFGNEFVRRSYRFCHVGQACSTGADDYHYDYSESSPRTLKTVSVPLSSQPDHFATGGSFGCCHFREGPCITPHKTAGSLNAAHQRSPKSANGSVAAPETPFRQTESFPIFEDSVAVAEHGNGRKRYHPFGRSSDQSWNWPPSASGSPASAGHTDNTDRFSSGLIHWDPEAKHASITILDKSVGKTAENFRRWASTFRRKRSQRIQASPAVAESELPKDTPSALPTLSNPRRSHRKRISNASSRFVATVKTASLSNDSMSVFPRPHGQSRVSDTRDIRSSDQRPSMDISRPSSISSSDDGAMRRSIKRRQILQEILSSEESYVADLKALYSLFSTLLASIPSISTHTRISIQRNVMEMLQLHEQIINELHRVALRATLREWRYVASPLRLSRKRHRKWQSLDAASCHPSTPRGKDSDMAPHAATTRSRGGSALAADPAEVADVAQVFRNHAAQFFVYEEYSAKYDMMVQELAHSHKNVPHWRCYEAGIEALANAIASLDQRGIESRKGLTAADLLIKPIQRICKYPLFFGDLHRQTPVIDCPISHAEVDGVLSILREMVREINLATGDAKTRERIQRRWLLQDRLKLGPNTLKTPHFRMLGHVLLCGVLHVAYQTSNRVDGGYMLCSMFKDYLLIAAPAVEHGKFDIVATIYLSDAKVVSPEDGRGIPSHSDRASRADNAKGLQCHSALFSWKLIFESDSRLFEMMFSASSGTEEQQWLAAIERGRSLLALEGPATQPRVPDVHTTVSLDLKVLAPVFSQGGTLARRLSIQRAATVGTRITTCQVIIRNTHKPQDGPDVKTPAHHAVSRSQSLLTTHRTPVLAPKRSERVRLEQSLADVWTRDTLPYPGMTLPRGGNLIRVSAGSLVRKLSLASIHTPFAKRSTSMTLVGSHFSHDTCTESRQDVETAASLLLQDGSLRREVIFDHHHDCGHGRDAAGEGERWSDEGEEGEGEEMRRSPRRLSFTAMEKLRRRSTRKVRRLSKVGMESAAAAASEVEVEVEMEVEKEVEIVEGKLGHRKRWSNPLGLLKNLSAEGVRHLLYSSK